MAISSSAARTTLIAVIALCSAVIAWRFWAAARSVPATIKTTTNTAEDFADASKTWLVERARAAITIQGPETLSTSEAFEIPTDRCAAAGVTTSQASAAVRHAAEALYLRFVVKDFDRYTRWRAEHGYRFRPLEELRRDPMMLSMLEGEAGRKLRDNETDPAELWRDIWLHTIDPTAPVTMADVTPNGSLATVWKLPTSLALARVNPSRKSFATSLSADPTRPLPPRVDPALWRGTSTGQGWPIWLPPPEVEARLVRQGTPCVEVLWTLRTASGATQPLSLVVAYDNLGNRWWIVQFHLMHLQHASPLHGAGL